MKVNAKNAFAMAEAKFDENHEFRRFLKWDFHQSGEELDNVVFEITRRVWADFDCATCANCCKELGAQMTDAEADRLAQRLGMPPGQFRDQYLRPCAKAEDDPEDGPWKIKDSPCPFLKDNRCTVYGDHPKQCKGYPFLYEPEFSSRLLGMIERTACCPIVYQVMEELKDEIGFRRRRR